MSFRAADMPDRRTPVSTRKHWRVGRRRTRAAADGAAEAHVSTCARCQAMVGASRAHSRPGTSAPWHSRPGHLSLWRWWLVPIAAGVAAVTFWMVVPEQQQVADRAANRHRSRAEPRAPKPPGESTAPPPAPPAATAHDASRTDADVPTLATASARVARDERADSEQSRKQPGREAVTEQPSAAGNAAPAAPPPRRARRSARELPPASRELQKSARLAFAPLEIVSPDPRSRWRVVGGAHRAQRRRRRVVDADARRPR